MSGLMELKVEDVEAAVQEEQRTPGGMKMNIVLSPAIKSAPSPRSHNVSCSPSSQLDINERLAAAASRREMLDQLRVKNISSQLAKIEVVKQKKEEMEAEMSQKTKEELETKLETHEKNRLAQIQKNKEKCADELARVERAHRELEIQTEAARVATECAINAKLSKAQENREEYLEEMVKKLKEHDEYAVEVRLKTAGNQDEKAEGLSATLEKIDKAKMQVERDTVPESA